MLLAFVAIPIVLASPRFAEVRQAPLSISSYKKVFASRKARALAPTPFAVSYTWNQTGTAAWTTSTNWTPTRTTPSSDDILLFNNGATTTVTSVPNETEGQISVTNNTNVTLQAAVGATALQLNGGPGSLNVASGSQLNVNTGNSLSISLLNGSTGSISGSMTFSGGAHTLIGVNASAITFNSGATFTQGASFSGSAFGTTGTANTVVFASGSIFDHKAGSNPFGLGAPSSKVTFQSGSLYRITASGTSPSFAGRTYANFQYNPGGANSITASGSTALVMEDVTVTTGTFNYNMTGTPGHAIKGNVSVAAAGTLSFNPGSAGTVLFNGAGAQTISNSGALLVSGNQTFEIANTSGVTLNNAPSTFLAALTVDAGAKFALSAGLPNNGPGVTTVNGTLQLNQGGSLSGSATYGASSTLSYNGTLAQTTSSNEFPLSNGPTNLIINNAAGVTLGGARTINGTLTLTSGAFNNSTNNLTLGNAATIIRDLGSLSFAPVFGTSVNVTYTGTTAATTGNEIPASSPVLSSLTVNNTGGVTLGSNATVNGASSIGSGATLNTGAFAFALNSTLTNSGTFNVSNGGTFKGTGTVSGPVAVASGGTVAPGNSAGALSTGNVSFTSGSNFNVEIGGTTAGTQYDQLNVTGAVTLGNATLNLTQINSFVPVGGNTFTIINNDSNDAVSGTFNGLAEGAIVSTNFLGSGLTAKITYAGGTGNDVLLVVTSPPSLQKLFGTSPIAVGQQSMMTLSVTNPNPSTALTGISFTDTLPTGLQFNGTSGPDPICNGGTVTKTLTTLTISGGTEAALAGDCNITLPVIANGDATGLLTNTTSTVSSNEGGPGAAASAQITVQPAFAVSSTNPADGATGVSAGTSISVTFNQTAQTSTITTNTANTTCSGSLQVSLDSFSTCVQMSGAPATGDNTTFTVTPGSALAAGATYKIRVTTAAQSSLSQALASTFTQATGFTITDATVASDCFRSKATGAWSTAATWQSSHDCSGAFANPITATAKPTSSATNIVIVSPHIVTVSSNEASHNLTVNSGGELKLSSNTLFTSGSTTVNGTLRMNGGAIGNGPLWGSNSILYYDKPFSTLGRSSEWMPPPNLSYPQEVRVTTNTTVNIDSGADVLTVNGLLTNDGTLNMGSMTAELRVLGGAQLSGTTSLSTVAGGDLEIAGGDFFNNGAGFTSNAGKLKLSAAGSHFDTFGNSTFGDIVIAAGNHFAQSALSINGNLTQTGGTFDNSNFGTNFVGNANQTVSGSGFNFSSFNSKLNPGDTGTVDASGATFTTANLNVFHGTLIVGSPTVTGNVNISSGATLVVNGTLGNTSAFSVPGTLGGTGTVGPVNISSGGAVAPGNSPGILNTGSIAFSSGSNFNVEIGGTTAGTDYDQLNVTGTVTLGNATLNLTQINSFAPAAGNTFKIINNDSNDAVSGTFNGLAEGAVISNNFFGSGLSAKISYAGGDGNDVVITVVSGNTISGTVLNAAGSPLSGKTIKLIQNGTLSGATATTDGSGLYTFTGLTLVSGQTLAVYISGASEKGATATLTAAADITTLDIYQNRLIIRSDNGSTITNANLKSAQGATPEADLISVDIIDVTNVVTTPAGFGLQIWSGTTYQPDADINNGGDWINNGTFNRGAGTVTFNSTNSNQTIKGNNATVFNNLVIANTGTSPNNVVTLDVSSGAVNTTVAKVDVSNGVFDLGDGATSTFICNGSGDVVTVRSGATWRWHGFGTLTLWGDVNNSGTIDFNSHGTSCPDNDDILIRSFPATTQRTWKGNGTFSMTDVDVQYQKVPGLAQLPLQILVNSGTDHPTTNNGWLFTNTCSGPYTWIGGPNQDWTIATNWSPVRGTPATSDILIFDGNVTPSPIVTNVPNETDAQLLLTNGVSVTLGPNTFASTLTLNGKIDIPNNNVLKLAGSGGLTIALTNLASNSTIAGGLIFQDSGHRLTGQNVGQITFAGPNGFFTADSGFSGNPFGSGTSGSVVFQSGATGNFNDGSDPFGGALNSVAVFNLGSNAIFRKNNAFSSGRTYGNLTLAGNQNYSASGSTPTTILNNFILEDGSTFTLALSPNGDLTIDGNFEDQNLLPGKFDANLSTVTFAGGTAQQTITKAGTAALSFRNVVINNSGGGKVTLLTPVTIGGDLNLPNSGSLLELNGRTLELDGTISGPGNLKGDINANLAVNGTGDLGTVNFVTGARTLSTLSINRALPSGSMTLGTNLSLAGNLLVANGIIHTGANTLSLSSDSGALATSGYVIGNLQKSFGLTGNLGTFRFPLGTANAYSPLDANVTANTNGTLTATVFQVHQPNISGANALQRYWTLSGSGITANLTFHYSSAAPNDIAGNEANYKIFKYDGAFTQFTPDATGSNSASDHFATINNVSSFSDWTLAEPSAINAGSIAFANAPYTTNEGSADHNRPISVRRSGGTDGTVTVHYATSAGTAAAGSDYTEVSGTLTWNDGDSTDKTFDIPVIGDTDYEANETVTITLSAATGGATITAPNPTTLTIVNDDSPAANATLIVNTTDDVDNGACLAAHCSLREAINAANANADSNTINFNIPNSFIAAGVFTIQPTLALPNLATTMTIDGTSQTSFGGDTNPNGPEVVLTGISLPPGTNAFTVSASNCVIKGLVINGSNAALGGAANGTQVLDNYIGTNASGTAAVPNTAVGLSFGSGSGVTLSGNLISGNNGAGVSTCDLSNATFSNNKIGTDRTGTVSLGNTGPGISTFCATFFNNTISGNTIAFNGGDGFFDQPDFTGTFHNHLNNRISQNSIFANTGLGINLNPPPDGTNDGATANDNQDPDIGSNNLQNFPVLATARVTATGFEVTGTLNTTPNSSNGYTIEFFKNSACDGSGNGEGQTYLGNLTTGNTDANGNVPFTFNSPAPFAAGDVITATATDNLGNTSEFSACLAAVCDVATPTATNGGPYCVGATISLLTPTVAGATYAWTGPNSFTSPDQNPTRTNATLADAGTYSVTITVNGCTSAAGTTNVTVNNCNSDISVSKSAPASVTEGNDFNYTITVTNSLSATATATGVSATDILPAGVTFVSASAGCVNSAGTVTCNGADLLAGSSDIFTIAVTAGSPGVASNMATASASNDLNPSHSSNTTSTNINPAVCATPPAGMTAWWPGDGNAHDIKGGAGSDGTLQGGATFAAAKVDRGFSLNGSNQFIQVADGPNVDITGAISIDAWIKTNSVANGQVIVSKYDRTQGDAATSYLLTMTAGGGIEWAVYQGDGTFAGVLTSGPVITPGVWIHVAGTFTPAPSQAMKVYINGVDTNAPSIGGSVSAINNSSTPLRIGVGGDGGAGIADPFNGIIDEVELFNTAISASDVAAIYNASFAGKCRTCTPPPGGMVSWWDGSGIGSTANDISDGSPGTLQDGAAFTTGKVGQGFNFTGAGQTVLVPHNANQNTGAQLTADAWINPSSVPALNSNPSIINKRTNANAEGYTFEINNAGNGLYFEITTSNGVFSATAANVLTLNTWHHVAATYDGGALKIFVNGIQVASSSGSGTINPVTANLEIGRNIFTGASFPGKVDEVELFNRALSQLEIAALADAGAAGKCHTSTVSVDVSPASVAEDGAINLVYTFRRNGDNSSAATVNFSVGGTAIFGTDYTQSGATTFSASAGTLAFAAGEATKTITIDPTPDNAYELGETVVLTVTSGTGYDVAVNPNDTATGTIADDDSQPAISINDVTLNEGNAGPTDFDFTVSLSNASYQTVTVSAQTSDGTAKTSDSDYVAVAPALLTFNPGETTQHVHVNVNGDTKHEANETFFVNLSGATNATILDGQGLGTITNDDACASFSTVYVDDDWATKTIGDDPDGTGLATTFGCDSFATIQEGINAVTAGGRVIVNAGTYKENPTVNKAVSIEGPNVGVAGSTVRPAEATVVTNGNQTAVFTITSNNVTIDGFTIDGDDSLVAGGTLKSGDDANAAYGVRPTGAQNHITVQNNIVQHVAIGFRGDGASQNNLITANWFDSVGNFDFGYCVSLRKDYYADVTNNKMTRAWTGIHINDHHTTGGPANFNLSGNDIRSYAGGILYWLNYNLATGATINGNTITAESGAVANNFGLLIVTLQDAVPTTITNNTITGHNYGVGVFNAPTSNSVTLGATNSIKDSTLAGVFLTDNLNFNPVGGTNFLDGGPGAASTVNLVGLPVTGNVSNGLKVEGLTNLQTLGVSGGTSVSGGTVGLLMTGAKTAVAGNSLNDTSFTGQSTDYIQLANSASGGLEINATSVSFDGKIGASATLADNYFIEDRIIHAIDDSSLGFVRVKAGNVFVTPNSFVSPNTAASIQRAIDAAIGGDNVNIQAGTYQGGVNASAKAITLSPGASPAQVFVNGNLILTGDDTLIIEINGTNAATDYDNFVVSGTVTLGGATLSPPTGTHAPMLGETFTIISNNLSDTVSGTFNGLPEGAIISPFLGSSFNARISYAADGDNDGNNNDVVLTVVNPPPAVGNYPASPVSVQLSGDTSVSPDVPPSDTTSIYVSTSTDFKGKLEGDPATGAVRVTDANPAGNYTITVKAFGPSGSVTKTFTLSVTTPATCNPVVFGPEIKVSLPSSPSSVAVGDFNGDGKQDLAAANFQSDNVSITLGDGAGAFTDITAGTDFPVASQPYSVAVGDFNGDGKQDLVTANFGTHNVSILLGVGDGTFSAPTNFPSGTGARAVAVGDFNGDGKPDLAVANASANNVSILIGNGAGSFSAPTTFGAGVNPYSIAVGDFNADGKQDLAVANYSVDDGFTSNGVSILLGNGDGSFGTNTNFAAGTGPRSVVVGDFNADGKQDLAVANERSSNVSILLGNGDGTFGAANNFGSFGPEDSPVSVAAGDFNGDGKQDVAMADYVLQKVVIWLGDGAGNLSTATNLFNGNNPAAVAVGDFDGDGMQDVAVGNARTYLSIFLRRCCPTITLSPASLPNGGVGSAYPNNITASGGTGPYTFTVTTGSVPTGLALNTDGTWSGTASASGNFSFTVTATDSATGCIGTQGYTVTIVQGVSVAVSPASVPENSVTGMVYTFTRTDSAGALTVNFAATGTADPNSDYNVSGATFNPVSGTGTVAFSNGELTKGVTVTPVADSAYEANETVIITISPSPSDYNPLSGSDAATGTITNDDNPPANSQTFTVNNTSDDDDGACLPSPGRCSLRDAINAANANNDTNRIEFGIPADDPHHYYYADSCDGDSDGLLYPGNVTPTTEPNDQTLIDQVLIDPDWAHSWWSIEPAENLPAIIHPVTIDGYTQTGAEENTDPTCQDGVLRIELNGDLIDGATGLDLQAGASTIKGLVINRFVNYYDDVPGTGQGIKISQNGGNTITGNFIGTDVSGTLAGDDSELFFGNQVGILIDTVGNNTIGGPVTNSTNATLRNLISANGEEGIEIVVTPVVAERTRTAKAPGLKNLVSTGNKIQGNFIGTDAHGITVFDSSGADNLMGNFIGISIYDGVNNVVGNSELAGPAVAGAGNVISGNFWIGVELASGLSGGPSGNGIGSNFIGTDLTGELLLGTLVGDGVQLCQDSHDNLVGGSTADYSNVIAYNGNNGVNVLKSAFSGNTIRLNSIHDNSYLGIDLNDDGFTGNDPGDGDQGPNDLQNFPTITGATIVSGNITITGNLNSTPAQGQTYKIDFYANASCNDDQPDGIGHGEGQTYLGTVMADGDGTQFTTAPIAVPLGAGPIITATATDQFGSTSEFSQCFAAVTPAIVQFAQANTNDTETNSGSHPVNIAVSRSNSTSGAVDVNYTVTGGTATTADNDYSIVSPTGTLHWDDGDSTDKTITINVNGDTTVEADETVNLALSTPTGAQLGAQATSTLTIVNDDVACPTTFLVNSLADTDDQNPGDGHCDIDGASGDQCTLRAAIREANALSSCGAITIDATGVSGTINLSSVLPDINHNVSINGPGANALTVKRNAAGSFRIFTIDLNRTVSISGLTISNGSETVGGGIYNNHGTLTIDGCEISGNVATSEGGGIYNGGITVGTATLTITNSTISGNSSVVDGGGIYSDADSGPAILTMTNCTVSTNTANGNAGGVAVNSSTATLTNVTVTNNHADNDTNSAGNGGGLSATSSNVTLRNTIVAGNFRGGISSTTRDDVNGAITATSKKNLIGDGTGMTGISNGDANGNQVGSSGSPIDALLGKLIYNGGTTRTHGLLYNSPAIDAGDDTVSLSTDQRGLPRPADGDLTAGTHIDIGSYERQATETRTVPSGPNVNIDINDAQVTFPCTPANSCLATKANPDTARTEARNVGPALVTPTVSLTDVDPASMPAPPSGFVLGNSTSPALPAFNVSPGAVTYDSPVTLCFYLPSINDSTFFEGIRLFHQNGSSLDLLSNQTRNFANRTVCGQVTSFSNFAVGHTATPTATNAEISGQILDDHGNPVEGAAVRMSGAQDRLTISDAAGNYHFDNVETNGFYVVTPSRTNFSFSPTQRSFSQLGAKTEAVFTGSLTGTAVSPLDATEYFVRQHYLDFLGREPDESGFNFWVNNIESCGTDLACREVKRIDTSAAFFLSIEFQHTGFLVYRAYEAAYGDLDSAPVPMSLREFTPDTQKISNGLVVNQSGWQQKLETNKQAFMNDFVQRPRFTNTYPISMTPAQFVDKLFATAHVESTDPDYAASLALFGPATDTSNVVTRALVLRRLAENSSLTRRQFNRAFVLMEYFGYLKRDPNSGRDTDFAGYSFWLDKLNSFNGNFENAEMVKAFLSSPEYRGRFPR